MQSILKEMGVQLFDLHLIRLKDVFKIQVLVDKPEGGITIDECSLINKHLNEDLIESQILGDEYTIEVSSPGLDRPLKTKKDFFRVVGRKVRFHLLEPQEKKLEYHGTIEEVQEDNIVINLITQNGSKKVSKKNKQMVTDLKQVRIPLKNISKAIQIV